MKALREFDIHIFKLANGLHEHQFEITDSLFELFDNEAFKKGKLLANVKLDKSDSMIQMSFDIKGHLELTCDRSLELFDEPIALQRDMIFKYGDEEKELSEDVLVILKDTQIINVGSLVYEFIGLEVPMKKLHPRFREEESELDDDEVLMIYSSEEGQEEEEQEEQGVDPRWEALKKLKDKD